MSDLMSHLKTVNSSVRTLLIVGVCGVVGYGGYFGYENYVKPSQDAKRALSDMTDKLAVAEQLNGELSEKNGELTLENGQLTVKNERLETTVKLLKVDRRVANVTVLEKGTNEQGNPYMEVSFQEIDQRGDPIGVNKNFTVLGDKIYIDGWVAQFQDKYTEEADELRGESLFVFKSIHGDAEAPKDAQRLDVQSNDLGPGIYNDQKKRAFEQKIWGDFWRVCNDLALQEELGIKAVHGQSNYVFGETGKTYQIKLRASGSMSLKPVGQAAKEDDDE